jgi:hypothetical protein
MLARRKILTIWVRLCLYVVVVLKYQADSNENLGYNPQFKLVVKVPEKKTSAVWLLMSKHITVTEPKNTDFITLHVYNDTNGERVYHHGKAFKEGTYVNSPHILVSMLVIQTKKVIASSSFQPVYSIRSALMHHRERLPTQLYSRNTRSSKHFIFH